MKMDRSARSRLKQKAGMNARMGDVTLSAMGIPMQQRTLIEAHLPPYPLAAKRTCVVLNRQLLLDVQLGREAPSRVQVLAHQTLGGGMAARMTVGDSHVIQTNDGQGSW